MSQNMIIKSADLTARSVEKATAPLRLKSLHQAFIRLADLKGAPSALTTRSLLGLLACQSARNKRFSHPYVHVYLRVMNPTGKLAVKIRLG